VDFALLLVIDTNYQLTVYTHEMHVIMSNVDFYQMPQRPPFFDEHAPLYIENVKKISILCMVS
jgi:hypothetical protein